MAYQTFQDEEKGDSDSPAKLIAFNFPSLEGKTFLDLGCNEGFFCGKALELGAKQVRGIDKNAEWLGNAQKRFPKAEFLCRSWEEGLPNQKFDVILISSALHYSKTPEKLIEEIHEHLNPTGVFILECGIVAESRNDAKVVRVARYTGSVVPFPTEKLLIENYLKSFNVKKIGGSVPQEGDPVPRFVYHCFPKQKELIFLTEENPERATAAARFLSKSASIFSLKQHWIDITNHHPNSELGQWFEGAGLTQENHFSYDFAKLNNGLDLDQYAESIFDSLPIADTLVIQGAELKIPAINEKLKTAAKNRGYQIWEINPA